jgi:transcriptional regulator with XRE-family HTH domain
LSNIKKIIVSKLKDEMDRLGMSQAKFGELIGVTYRQQIYALFQTEGKGVSVDKLEEYLGKLNLTVEDVILEYKEDTA